MTHERRDCCFCCAGEEPYLLPEWGTPGYLVACEGSSAWAKFGGGGSIDVPQVCSDVVAEGPTGRAYWEVRVEKKNGLLRCAEHNTHTTYTYAGGSKSRARRGES